MVYLPKEFRYVTLHEAAHAVIGYLTRRGVKRVVIVPTWPYHGSCEYRGWNPGADNLTRWRREQYALCLLAGEQAAVYAGCKPKRAHKDSKSDRQKAIWQATLICDGDVAEADALYKWLEMRAHRLVVKHWPVIKALADALVDKHEMTGKEVHAVIRKALAQPAEEAAWQAA